MPRQCQLTGCQSMLPDDNPDIICRYSHYPADWTKWAEENRIYCDFFHRGKELPRVPDDPAPPPSLQYGDY